MSSPIIVSALFSYPIKSCGYNQRDSLVIGKRGPEGDRLYMITNKRGVYLTQRDCPKMAWLSVHDHQAKLFLRMQEAGLDSYSAYWHDVIFHHDNPKRVRVWLDYCQAVDQGDRVADWLSNQLGIACRLVRMANNYVRPVDSKYAKAPAQTGFSDGFPLLLISDASLADLNSRLQQRGKPLVQRENFRSNIWVTGCEPFAEDDWKRIGIGEVEFEVVKPCARCAVTTVDLATGSFRTDKEPLATLATYRKRRLGLRRGVMFGQNLVHRCRGTLNVGDKLEVLEPQGE